MQYRIQQITQERSNGEVYIHMEWVKGEPRQLDLNRIYCRVQLLQQNIIDHNITYVVKEYQADADLLSNEVHLKGCAKYLLDFNTPRKFSARCSCPEIRASQTGTKIGPESLHALIGQLQAIASTQLDEE